MAAADLDRDLGTDLPEFTSHVLKRVSQDCGLPWVEGNAPAPVRVLSVGLPRGEQVANRSPFKLPSDILAIWNGTSSSNPSSFSKALRVAEEDYRALIQTPRIDEALVEHRPQSGKAAPSSYSPYWESELSQLDTRLAAGVRLGSVASVTADHLSRTLATEGGTSHPLVQEAMLLTDLNMHLLRVAMSARRRITELRRQQILQHIHPSLGEQFLKLIKDKEVGSQEDLFGGKFPDKLRERAEVLANEALVRKDAQAVHKSVNPPKAKRKKSKSKKAGRSSKKAKTPRAQPVAPPAPATTTTPAPSATATTSKGKRGASAPPKNRKSKKARRGAKGDRS